MTRHATFIVGCWVLTLAACLPAHAQGLPDRPVVFGDGHVALGGDVSWSIAPEDTGFFNYTDYERSTLRMLRLALLATVKAGDHIEVLGELRSENGDLPEVYALYLRLRPWTNRALDIQVGRVPPTFGAFARRTYAADNPLIGYPLGYQYLTSLRADALPATVDELLRMRARGWLASYSVGNSTPSPGVPLVSAFRWDTGVQVHTGNDLLDATAAITTGTLSNPQTRDDNGGRQLTGRLALHPIAGLIVGGSASRGAFVSQSALHAALADGRAGDFTQTAWGVDVEYSAGYYLVRFENIFSRWTLPVLQAPIAELPLSANATSVEGVEDSSRPLRRRAIRPSGIQRGRRVGGSTDLGRTGRPLGNRRRLLAAAQSGVEARVSAKCPRRWPRVEKQPRDRPDRVLVLAGLRPSNASAQSVHS